MYEKHGVCGGFGIGCSLGGMSMTMQRVINCCLRYPRSRSDITTIEFMVRHGCTIHHRLTLRFLTKGGKSGAAALDATTSVSRRTA